MKDQGRRDRADQPAAAKLTVGLKLDLEFPPTNRREGSCRPALNCGRCALKR
jgi:hypothetical protein